MPSRAAAGTPTPPPTSAAPVARDGRDDDDRSTRESLPVWIGSGALLTAAVATAVAARRRRRDRTTGRSSTPPPPDERAAGLHTAVLHAVAADADATGGVGRLDAALRSLAALHRPGADGEQPAGPLPQAVLVRPDGTIDVYLRIPREDPPDPWRADAGGRVWVLPADAAPPAGIPDMPPPCPTLAQIGAEPDGAAVYLDLEAVGVLAVDPGGHGPAGLRSLCRALLATLALSPLSPLAARPTVHTFGFDPLGLADDERVEPADTLDDLASRVRDDLSDLTAGLAAAGRDCTLTARAAVPEDDWDPAVALVAATAADPAVVGELAALAGDGCRGLALVAPAHPDLPARWTLTLLSDGDGGRPVWRLDPLGLTLAPAGLAADELADLCALLDDAQAPPVPAEPPPPADESDHADHAAGEPVGADGFAEPDWAVVVGLLGPLDVAGRDGRTPAADLARERTVEVLAWLATHRGRTRTDLEAALWPAGALTRSVNNQIGRARRILVDLAGPDARGWIPTQRTKITLHPLVVTDLDLLAARLAHAETHRDRPDVVIPTLAGGLDLVRGTPATPAWIDAELGSTLTTAVVRAALLLAEAHLARGDHRAVLDAAARGLAVLPTHPGLFALRLRAHAAAGDRAAVKAEYHAFLRAEQADPLSDGDTDRDLEALYHRLTRRPAPGR
jgi:DNA-binding SARP family transcriptional activator